MYGTIAEPLVALGFLAGRTRTLELGVSALVVPQRNPLVALKQLTTLDLLSGGRLVTAVAAGWMEGEFATLGAPFDSRGRLLDEWLDAAAAVFDQMPGPVRWEGELLSFEGWLVGAGRPPRPRGADPPLRQRGAALAEAVERARAVAVGDDVELTRGVLAERRDQAGEARL